MATAAAATPSDIHGSQVPQQQQIPVQLSTQDLQWDYMCSKPLPDLTFILKCFMPETNHTSSEGYRNRLENLKRQCDEVFPHFKNNIFCDALCLPIPLQRKPDIVHQYLNDKVSGSETNHEDGTIVMLIKGKYAAIEDKSFNQGHLFKIKETSPGYLNLIQADPFGYDDPCTLNMQGTVYLSSSKVVEGVTATFKDKFPQNPNSIERVICMACPVWPQQNMWCERDRPAGWPSDTLRKKITDNGCYVVPVPHEKSSCPDVEWSFSFLTAEKLLMEELTPDQKCCFLLLNTLVQYELSPPHLLSISCLKYHFFHCMENIPKETWEDECNGLASAFLYVIDELLYAVVNETLPHYFMPRINMIDNIPEDFLDELLSKISMLRRDPLKYLVHFDKIYFFQHSCATKPLKELLQPVLDDCHRYHNELRQCQVNQYKSLGNLSTAFLKEGNFPKSYVTLESACLIANQLGVDQKPADLMESSLLHLEDPKIAISGFEYMEGMSSTCCSGSFLGNMACMYASLYNAEPDGPTKEMYKQKADQKFEASLSSAEVRGASGVDYSVFLRKCERYNDAIAILLKVLPHEKQSKSSNMYGQSEKNSMDVNLNEEIEERGEISAPSLIFALYQLCHCYIETNQIDIAKELMPDFAAACQQQEKQEPFLYHLLGYCYFDLNDFRKASEAFGQALRIDPTDNLAINKQMISDAMNMSLG